jgi:hypothetical protein
MKTEQQNANNGFLGNSIVATVAEKKIIQSVGTKKTALLNMWNQGKEQERHPWRRSTAAADTMEAASTNRQHVKPCHAQGCTAGVYKTLVAILAVLEIIGRQGSPASCRAKKKRKCKIIKIVVDFCCLLWYIIGVGKTLTTKQRSKRCGTIMKGISTVSKSWKSGHKHHCTVEIAGISSLPKTISE